MAASNQKPGDGFLADQSFKYLEIGVNAVNFEEFKRRFRYKLLEMNIDLDVTDEELIKLFISHVVIGEYEKELLDQQIKLLDRQIKKMGFGR